MLSRRSAATVIGASLLTGACVTPERQDAPILVNLADQALEPDADTANLGSAADIADRVTAPVRINGQGPYDFVVDTGANRSVISAELAATLGLRLAGKAQIHGIAGVESSETAIIDRLDVGQVSQKRLRAPMLSRARLGADGLLGVDVLKNRRVAIDFKRNTITIGRPREDEPRVRQNVSDGRLRDAVADSLPGNVVVVPARYRFGQLIIIDADMGGVPVTAFLDSGSQNTVGNLQLYKQLQLQPNLLAAQVSVVRLISATGQTADGQFSTVPPLRMGGLGVGNLSAVFADLHIFKLWDLNDRPAILVGIDVMRHFDAIELDFANRRVLFRTPARMRQAGS